MKQSHFEVIDQHVNYEETQHPEDRTYNIAIDHCIERINIELRALEAKHE